MSDDKILTILLCVLIAILFFCNIILISKDSTISKYSLVKINNISDYLSKFSASNATVINNYYYGSANDTRYNVSTVQTVYGTSTTSDLNLLKIYDSITWNISENLGSNPMDFRINFTGVTSLNKIYLRERYEGGSGHELEVDLWDYVNSNWENYMLITDQSKLEISEIPVIDPTDHISGGKVQMRIYHLGTGISSHRLYIDFVQAVQSASAITSIEHDSLSGRNNICTNHPEVCLNYVPYDNAIQNVNLSTKNITTTKLDTKIIRFHKNFSDYTVEMNSSGNGQIRFTNNGTGTGAKNWLDIDLGQLWQYGVTLSAGGAGGQLLRFASDFMVNDGKRLLFSSTSSSSITGQSSAGTGKFVVIFRVASNVYQSGFFFFDDNDDRRPTYKINGTAIRLWGWGTTALTPNNWVQIWYSSYNQTAFLQTGNGSMTIKPASAKTTIIGELNITGIASDGYGEVLCIKSDKNIGTCTTAINATGKCTCT